MKKTSSSIVAIVVVSLALGMILISSALAGTSGSWTDQPTVALSASTHAVPNPQLVMLNGKIFSDHKTCRIGRPVVVFTGKNGEGVVGTTVSGSRGRFSMPAFVDANHVYHADVKGKVGGTHPDIQTCNDARSNGWQIRVVAK